MPKKKEEVICPIEPVGRWILTIPLEEGEMSGKIFVPGNAQEGVVVKAKVLACGAGENRGNMFVKMPVKVDQVVAFSQYARPESIYVKGTTLHLYSMADVVAILHDVKVVAVDPAENAHNPSMPTIEAAA